MMPLFLSGEKPRAVKKLRLVVSIVSQDWCTAVSEIIRRVLHFSALMWESTVYTTGVSSI